MAKEDAVVTGYYRYTDIWFHWPDVLPEDQKRVIKATLGEATVLWNDLILAHSLIAHDALVDDNHPLHVQGVKGVQLYHGTFQNGQSRLMFSSKQIDYVRYWLHAMGLTEEEIPLPYSNCLVLESSLRQVSPIVYEDGGALRGALKQIDKNNKKLRNAAPFLGTRRDMFENVRKLWQAHTGTWIAIDFEEWERDSSMVTEFGYSSVRFVDGAAVGERGHDVVKEYKGYRNGNFVEDNRDHYNFGETQEVTKKGLKDKIAQMLTDPVAEGPVYLVFHDPRGDIQTLKSKQIEAPLGDLTYLIPDTPPEKGMVVIDTSEIFCGLSGDGDVGNRRSLQQMARLLDLHPTFLHNAGNDAHYTMLALREMASGEQLDIQRERRWPNRTGETEERSVKVQFREDELDPDCEDTQAVLDSLGAGYDPFTGKLLGALGEDDDSDYD
ncbi:hypothetical protein BD626DRAFT_449731 [Schizophyllum amplum]|uniref:Gfd2/YDR514C-like C-terminal domain-containing protein n=1 Tax=Schizophyllum amplum TaxID=97359 RepID=A0A550CSE9_9AGAR|nr:hypothetical protein BD626DRAFT_449731 [Auriculariopsis ampla]